MSYNQYSGYGGNPYGGGENPYGGAPGSGTGAGAGGYGAQNPYGASTGATAGPGEGYGAAPHLEAPPPLGHHQASDYSQTSNYSANVTPMPSVGETAGSNAVAVPRQPLSTQDFLSTVGAINADIDNLSSNITAIGTQHQRLLASTSQSDSSALNNLTTQTQVLNTKIKDAIKRLEADASRTPNDKTKQTQIRQLKKTFEQRLRDYQKEEVEYEKRYREAIKRQMKIVNPDASEGELEEAAQANWGDEGVFQTALKSNRSATSTSVLGAVRARHNDIARIEQTLVELNQLFAQMAEQVIVQEPLVERVEESTARTADDTTHANVQLDRGIASAKRARKLKWITLGIVVLIIAVLALALGIYFGTGKNKS